MKHAERKHSKFSASGSERWFNCSGSVELSEGIPPKDSIWSVEGTQAHEVLEMLLRSAINKSELLLKPKKPVTAEMISYGHHASEFIMNLAQKTKAEVIVETRIHLPFIHPEMFGTFDGAVIDHFGTLHVFDYKYGAGVPVSPVENLQMIFYGMGLAYFYDWNFKNVRLWIIQPRIKGYEGPLFWDVPILELKAYVDDFKAAVERVENNPDKFTEGSWCHWCIAKKKCPLKQRSSLEKAMKVFSKSPITKG